MRSLAENCAVYLVTMLFNILDFCENKLKSRICLNRNIIRISGVDGITIGCTHEKCLKSEILTTLIKKILAKGMKIKMWLFYTLLIKKIRHDLMKTKNVEVNDKKREVRQYKVQKKVYRKKPPRVVNNIGLIGRASKKLKKWYALCDFRWITKC
ncbi:hypothetical protein THOM_2274 [Trachipleistophora hominis]|uniref:Uncharacterized protein n=1 Tax=Trachipleistophora hominis TaxID=72359 RepID=L7JVN3_TRAHO|nr:hypothetical protein THOM_2274 [Trachipleistophora hominis]